MKRITTPLFYAASALVFLVAIRNAPASDGSNGAMVNRVNGLYVFTDSYPAAPYEVAGTVKITIGLKTQYENVRDRLVKKVKADYPNAQGIIIYPNNAGSDRAEAIIFK